LVQPPPRRLQDWEIVTIVDTTKFVIGIVFAVIGVAVLVVSRGERGFGQRKQAGALFMVGAAVVDAVGVGLVDL
jgi:drug/metabolite transporter (DMT)-like permease